LTLTEKTTLSNPVYLFQFQSKLTGDNTLVTADDFSQNLERYNSFTFSEGSGASASGGFTLDAGNYDYFVWASTQSNFSTASGEIVEIGLLNVIGTQSNYNPIYDNDDDEYVYVG
jgi:hypothetical protein